MNLRKSSPLLMAAMVASIVAVSACASHEAPTKQLADSEAAVRTATVLGARDTPDAALHLDLAKDRLAKAKSLSARGESDSAKLLLEEAKADAELAVALTREEQAETDARNAQQELRSVPKDASQPAVPKDASQPAP
jgi:hypothetical protein